MATWKYSEDRTHALLNEKSTSRLKVTGTRFGAVLDLNKWSSPFQMWCEITKVAKKPFVGNDATNAGIVIEVKQQKWAREHLSPSIQSPEMYWGKDLEKNKFDYFKFHPIFGGMWDAVDVDSNGKIANVIEFKTTKRADDWVESIPVYYQVQVLLYAHLLGVKDCTIVCSFVDETDYIDPSAYIVDDTNTRMWKLNTDTTLIPYDGTECTIAELVDIVEYWYEEHIEKGISPKFDTKRDKEYLDLMSTTFLAMATDVDDILVQREQLNKEIEELIELSGIKKLKEDLAALDSQIKTLLSKELSDEKKKIVYKNVSINRVDRVIVDTDKLKEHGLFEDFTKTTTSVTYKVKKEEN